jgi:hypothetical protein
VTAAGLARWRKLRLPRMILHRFAGARTTCARWRCRPGKATIEPRSTSRLGMRSGYRHCLSRTRDATRARSPSATNRIAKPGAGGRGSNGPIRLPRPRSRGLQLSLPAWASRQEARSASACRPARRRRSPFLRASRPASAHACCLRPGAKGTWRKRSRAPASRPWRRRARSETSGRQSSFARSRHGASGCASCAPTAPPFPTGSSISTGSYLRSRPSRGPTLSPPSCGTMPG